MIDTYFLRCDQERQYRGYVGQIENTLKAKQSYVGGLIQVVSLTPEIIVICNDEGKIQQLPPNRAWVESSGVVEFLRWEYPLCQTQWGRICQHFARRYCGN